MSFALLQNALLLPLELMLPVPGFMNGSEYVA